MHLIREATLAIFPQGSGAGRLCHKIALDQNDAAPGRNQSRPATASAIACAEINRSVAMR